MTFAALLTAWLLGIVLWDTIRRAGRAVGDRDYIEAAPVLAGVGVMLAYVASVALLPAVESTATITLRSYLEWVATRAAIYGCTTMLLLLTLEMALWDEGYLEDHEWRLLGGIKK